MKPEIHTIYSECGDWVALYINGELIDANHSLERINILKTLERCGVIGYTTSEEPEEFWDKHGYGPNTWPIVTNPQEKLDSSEEL